MKKPIVQKPATKPIVQKPRFTVASPPVRKQEEAAEAKPPEPTPLEACITEKMGQGMSEEEATNACKAELEGEKEPPPTEEKGVAKLKTVPEGFMDKMVAVFEESMEKKFAIFEKKLETRLAAVVKEKEDEAVVSLRKGLGLNEDPAIHLSEIEGLVRKILLDKEPHGKRTLTEIGDKPTEGAELNKTKAIVSSAKDIYADLMKNKGGL